MSVGLRVRTERRNHEGERMTVEMLLIRHAAHGDLGKILTGRTTGVPLTAAGREQAKALAAKLGDTDLAGYFRKQINFLEFEKN